MEASAACAEPRPDSDDERVIAREGAASRSSLSRLRRCVEAGLLLLLLSHAAGVLPPLEAATGTGEAWRRPASPSAVNEWFDDDDRHWMGAMFRLRPSANTVVIAGVAEQRGTIPHCSRKRVICMTDLWAQF